MVSGRASRSSRRIQAVETIWARGSLARGWGLPSAAASRPGQCSSCRAPRRWASHLRQSLPLRGPQAPTKSNVDEPARARTPVVIVTTLTRSVSSTSTTPCDVTPLCRAVVSGFWYAVSGCPRFSTSRAINLEPDASRALPRRQPSPIDRRIRHFGAPLLSTGRECLCLLGSAGRL